MANNLRQRNCGKLTAETNFVSSLVRRVANGVVCLFVRLLLGVLSGGRRLGREKKYYGMIRFELVMIGLSCRNIKKILAFLFR